MLPRRMRETIVRIMRTRAGPDTGLGDRTEHDAAQAMTTLFQTHYEPLIRLAVLLVDDQAAAEDIVQGSFAELYGTWHALPHAHAALRYLRRSVVRRARAAPPGGPSDTTQAGLPHPAAAVVSALQVLPARQREVLVLRFFADLPEAEIASVTGIRTSAVRSHAARAMSSLRAGLSPPGKSPPLPQPTGTCPFGWLTRWL